MTVEWRERLDSVRIKSLEDFFGVRKPIIGMVHLWPLPGAPGYTGYGMQRIVDEALRDAETLLKGGVDALMVENMWDVPFYVQHDIPPEEMTAQAVAARAVVEAVDVPVGINVVSSTTAARRNSYALARPCTPSTSKSSPTWIKNTRFAFRALTWPPTSSGRSSTWPMHSSSPGR